MNTVAQMAIVTPDPEVEETHEVDVPNQLEIVKSEIENASAKHALEAVPKLIEARGKNTFALGGYLAKIKDEGLWPGAASFVEWMKTQGITKSRGYDLIRTYKSIVSCNLPTDILDRVGGWTKLIDIASLLKSGSKKAAKHNAKWIEEAEHSSRLELREKVKQEKGEFATPAPSDNLKRTLMFRKDQLKTYHSAIKQAKKETESDVDAVDAIFSGYLAGTTKTVTLKSMMEKSGPNAVLKTFGEIWPDIDIKMPF